ncbi:MAG: tripartite tricarboxylate transporter TctB family protein [Oxalobacteraceae bacterium]|jgi:putative tricarboxylic transport membrane protein|nr:tripartite tricarboxylate transporter TctB family protein [Oxalobacteraceae bacterium]
MKFNDAVSGALLLALAIAILFNVSVFPSIPGQNVGPSLFPSVLASLLAVCALLLIREGLSSAQPWCELGEWMRSAHHLRNFLLTLGCLVFYIVASDVLGFIVCGTLILGVLFLAFSVRVQLVLPLALLVTLVIHAAFYKGLRVPLPWGILQPLQW